MQQNVLDQIHTFFPGKLDTLDEGLKYLGYYIKANRYQFRDWQWLLDKLDHKINHWCNRFLTLGGRLTLLSSVLSAIPVYWFSLAQIPVAVTEALRKKMANFLWGQSENLHKYHLVSWKQIFLPKALGGWGIKQPYWFNLALCLKVAWRTLTSTGLWNSIIRGKYMQDLSFELWVRYRQSDIRGGSIFWRSVCKHFHWIHDGLAWLIGDGKQCRVGLDPFSGIKDDSYLLPGHMVISLQSKGLGRLNNIKNTNIGSSDYWITSTTLGFRGDDADTWNRYTDLLQHHGIRLTTNRDSLIWDHASDGIPSARTLYEHLIMELDTPQIFGWKHSYWKKHIPLKILCFWWLVLHHAILTWDNLIKRGHVGPGICVLCWDNTEDIEHLFVHCRHTRHIWSRLEEHFNTTLNWGNLDIISNFVAWTRNHSQFFCLPLLVSWNIWKARNKVIFELYSTPVDHIIQQTILLYNQAPGNKVKQKKKMMVYRELGPSTQNQGTFDGAAQTDLCGGGGTITLQDGRIYHFMAGLGRGTNNRAELLSLWTLLWTAKRLNCNDINILGDSQAVIDWVNKKTSLRNNSLAHWYYRTLDLMDTFTRITISHHHREFNQMADTLSKAGLQVEEGYIKLREVSITDTGDWEFLKIY